MTGRDPATDAAPPGRVYGGRSAEERHATRRTALVDAGFELFGTVGYHTVSIERICSQADAPQHASSSAEKTMASRWVSVRFTACPFAKVRARAVRPAPRVCSRDPTPS